MASITELMAKLKEKDVYAILCGYLFEFRDIPEYALLSELAFTLDCDSFLQLINCFEGQTITIPTKEEFKSCSRTLLLLKYTEVDKLEWKEALQKAGFQSNEGRTALNKLNKLKSVICNYNQDRG